MKEKELEFTIRILKDIIENNGGTYLVNRYQELQQQLKDLKDKNKETLEDIIYQSIGLAANEQGIINQALATSNIMKVLEKSLREAFKDGSLVASWSDMGISMKYDTFEDWFEQYKKK